MSKKIRVGVIGAGGMGTNIHVPSLAEIEECEIVAICDLYEEKAKALANRYGIKKTYALHHEMLQKEELDESRCFSFFLSVQQFPLRPQFVFPFCKSPFRNIRKNLLTHFQ